MSKERDLIIQTLKEWDPLHLGSEAYETEFAEIMRAVYVHNDPKQIANEIVDIFLEAYDEELSFKECEELAVALLVARESSSCDL